MLLGLILSLLSVTLATADLKNLFDCPCPNTCNRKAAKCQIKQKTNELLAIFRAGEDYTQADTFYIPNSGFLVNMEACTNLPGCCVQWYSPSDAYASFAGATVYHEVQTMNVTCDGQYIVKTTLILSYGAPQFRSFAY